MFTLDPKDFYIIYGGARVTGFADGTYIKIEFNADRYTLSMGADGLGARAKSNDKSAKITVTLQPNSVANKIFDAAQKLDDALNAGALPLVIRDNNNGDIFSSLGAWPMKDPGVERSKEIIGKEWVLETDALNAGHGVALT